MYLRKLAVFALSLIFYISCISYTVWAEIIKTILKYYIDVNIIRLDYRILVKLSKAIETVKKFVTPKNRNIVSKVWSFESCSKWFEFVVACVCAMRIRSDLKRFRSHQDASIGGRGIDGKRAVTGRTRSEQRQIESSRVEICFCNSQRSVP